MILRIIAVAVVLTVVATGPAHAQPVPVGASGRLLKSIAQIQPPGSDRLLIKQLIAPWLHGRGSMKQHILSAIGAFGGMVAGGYVGVKIEGNRCRCDDPGLAGLLIGAPVGAIVGGVVGYKLGR